MNVFFSIFAVKFNSIQYYKQLRKVYYIVSVVMMICIGCEFHLKPNDDTGENSKIEINRYDRLESTYLTTGDFSALQQMNTGYPMETRTLIEDVLNIGEVNDPEINSKFLNFYQDTVLQSMIQSVASEYANMDDINKKLNEAFAILRKDLPNIPIPNVYTQIGALDQSIVVGNQSIGISLDKYLGKDYPLYKKYYSPDQRNTMDRKNIVPDCLSFYILSLYPMKNFEERSQTERDLHIGKIQWVVNKVMKKKIFSNNNVGTVAAYMKHSGSSVSQLLSNNNYSAIVDESKKDVN